MIPSPAEVEDVRSFFVDRAMEVQKFQDTILQDDAYHKILFISGETDIGKTWLLHQFYIECKAKGWLTYYTDFGRSQDLTNYISVLEDIQVTFGQDFRKYRRRTSEMLQIKLELGTGAGDGGTGVHIGNGAEISGLEFTGQAAGRDIVNLEIREFYAQLKDLRRLQDLAVIQPLTQSFIEDLVEYIGDQPVIFLLDDIGNVDEKNLDVKTREWLVLEFIRPLIQDERLAKVRFVITQSGEPEKKLIRLMGGKASIQTLKKFDGDEETLFKIYKTYLVDKHGFDPNLVNPLLLKIFHKEVGGLPAVMNNYVLDLYS